MRTDEQARKRFVELTDELTVSGALDIIKGELDGGDVIALSTIYRVRKGECKRSMLHLLTYALEMGINAKNRVIQHASVC